MISYKFQGNVKNFDKSRPKKYLSNSCLERFFHEYFSINLLFSCLDIKIRSLDIFEFEFSKRNKFFSKIPIFPQRTRLANSSVARI